MDPQKTTLVGRVLKSPHWERARDWGEPRTGHPEGTIGRHVTQQLLPFIDRHYEELSEYWDLVMLAYLHDIGKPNTKYKDGHLEGDSHSEISAQIAIELGAPEHLVKVIRSNDRAYSHWRKLLDSKGIFAPARWTNERSEKFRLEFGDRELDLRLLVLFHRADNASRRQLTGDEQTDPVLWFENRLLAEGLLKELPLEGKDQGLRWLPNYEIKTIEHVDFIKPWFLCEPGLEKELKREVALNLQHPLFRVSARSIARRHDTDDVLFVLENYKYPIARVHLTWVAPEFGIAPEFNKEWPSTDLFENWGDWVERGMYPDADVWRLCEVDL